MLDTIFIISQIAFDICIICYIIMNRRNREK